MGFKKSSSVDSCIQICETIEEAIAIFESKLSDIDTRVEAFNYILKNSEIDFVLEQLGRQCRENILDSHVFVDLAFSNFKAKLTKISYKKLLSLLKCDNAYLRNSVISFVQDRGEEFVDFIKQLLCDDDRDIRIFALNIIGDLKFDGCTDMLREFLKYESDLNAIMTAVDYLGEIGTPEDTVLLDSIKGHFSDEPYVNFCIDMASKRLMSQYA